ncbi:MAG: thermonuclease family protein [Planctomycetes bacterium]|nr:thermonuclease family protein [Planctomycetota bacterium]
MRLPSRTQLKPLLAAFALLGWLAIAAWRGGFGQGIGPARQTLVTLEVLDGDTYRTPQGELIRLLGADTPERAAPWFEGAQEPWASRATDFARAKIQGANRVELLTLGERDAHGRLLAHVCVDGEPLAVLLVEAGLAYPTIPHYGDSGFPEVARSIEARARRPPFQQPWRWRQLHRQSTR